jgi:hypothetical protein
LEHILSFEIAGALVLGERIEELSDGSAETFHGSGGGFAQQMLEFGEHLSIGFRSGGYLGKKRSLAPAERISRRMILPLWLPRLSRMTMSPERKVGRRTFST